MSVPLMAPFTGERFADAASLGRRVAPPYDVIDPAGRAALLAGDPDNIVRIDLPAPGGGGDPYAEAARVLAAWRAAGLLRRDVEPCAYVLRTTSVFEGGVTRARTGVFLAMAAEPFSAGRVLPHEKTHKGPKEDRRRLTHATACNLSPIFVLAPDEDGALAALLDTATAAPPLASAEAVGGRQELWVVAGADAERIAAAAGAAPVYIADGHHRYETAVVVRGEAPDAWRAGAERTLAHVVSFKDPGLEILPTHRIVTGSPVSADALRHAAVGPWFSPASSSSAAVATVLFPDGTELPLACNPEARVDRVPGLPGSWAWGLPSWMCDDLLLRVSAAPLLGDYTLRYSAYEAPARAAAREPGVSCVVLLRATTIAEVRAVSDAGAVMPPKSTYFAPKVPTGVVLRPLTD